MALVKGVCPNCGKEIKIEDNDFNVICTFCGVPFFPHEAIDLYNKKINELLDNVMVDTLDVTTDNISNYASLGLESLKDKNHEKCGFYADDILKRNEKSPEGLLLKAFFISNNYSKEEGMIYYLDAYKNCNDKTLKQLIIDTFKEEFEGYSLDNFRYFINHVLLTKGIDDIAFIKYALTFMSTSLDTSIFDDLSISKDLLSLYFDLDKMNASNIENYDLFYNEDLLIFINGDLINAIIDNKLVSKEVERFAHNKDEETRNYYFYLEGNKMISLKFSKVNEEFEEIIKKLGFTLLEGKSGCYIATFVYDSYYHPNVRVLRKFRDEVLLNSFFGKLFVDAYYFISPILVKAFRGCNLFKTLNKNILDAFSNHLMDKGISSDYIKDKR